MGYATALDFASLDTTLEEQIAMHLRGNHYPPLPISLVAPCVESINAWYDDDMNRDIKLPDGISYKGLTSAPAWAIIEAHHLSAWCNDSEEDCD